MVLTILKNIKGKDDTPYEMENKHMFETTNQYINIYIYNIQLFLLVQPPSIADSSAMVTLFRNSHLALGLLNSSKVRCEESTGATWREDVTVIWRGEIVMIFASS